jgi:hypothetical protein
LSSAYFAEADRCFDADSRVKFEAVVYGVCKQQGRCGPADERESLDGLYADCGVPRKELVVERPKVRRDLILTHRGRVFAFGLVGELWQILSGLRLGLSEYFGGGEKE